jgi:hypothetical protein
VEQFLFRLASARHRYHWVCDLWLVTTGTGFPMARLRMTRSYAVALVFLESRTVDQSAFLTKLTAWPSELLESHSISDLWMFLLFAPIAAQLVLECERMLKNRSSRRMAQKRAVFDNDAVRLLRLDKKNHLGERATKS